MRSALDAWLLSGGVGGDVCDVAHVQGGVLRVSRGRGVARLVIGVVILRGVVGPAKREYRLLEAGLRAVARATQEIDGVGRKQQPARRRHGAPQCGPDGQPAEERPGGEPQEAEARAEAPR